MKSYRVVKKLGWCISEITIALNKLSNKFYISRRIMKIENSANIS